MTNDSKFGLAIIDVLFLEVCIYLHASYGFLLF